MKIRWIGFVIIVTVVMRVEGQGVFSGTWERHIFPCFSDGASNLVAMESSVYLYSSNAIVSLLGSNVYTDVWSNSPERSISDVVKSNNVSVRDIRFDGLFADGCAFLSYCRFITTNEVPWVAAEPEMIVGVISNGHYAVSHEINLGDPVLIAANYDPIIRDDTAGAWRVEGTNSVDERGMERFVMSGFGSNRIDCLVRFSGSRYQLADMASSASPSLRSLIVSAASAVNVTDFVNMAYCTNIYPSTIKHFQEDDAYYVGLWNLWRNPERVRVLRMIAGPTKAVAYVLKDGDEIGATTVIPLYFMCTNSVWYLIERDCWTAENTWEGGIPEQSFIGASKLIDAIREMTLKTRPIVHFGMTGINVYDTQKSVDVPVCLSWKSCTDVVAVVSVSGGTAQNGADYVISNSVVQIPAGQSRVMVPVTIFASTNASPPRFLELSITNQTDAAEIGESSKCTLTINTPVGAPSIGFLNKAMVVSNGAGRILVPIGVSIPSRENIIIKYNFLSQDAVSGVEFLGTSGELLVQAGRVEAAVPIEILQSMSGAMSKKVVVVQISECTGAMIGASSLCGVVIQYDSP